MDRGRGEIYDSDAEEEAEDHVPGGECARPIYEKLHMFLKGQGFPITSYLGPDAKRAASKDVMRELVGLCFNPILEDKESAMFPRVKQKLVDPQKFDPNQQLFAGGVHMPLLVYVGNGKPESGTGVWEKRRQRDQAFQDKICQVGGAPATESIHSRPRAGSLDRKCLGHCRRSLGLQPI